MVITEENDKKLISYFRAIFDAPPNLGQFNDRLAIQKIAYFLHAFRITFMDYHFIWYWRGVYSSLIGTQVYHLIGNTECSSFIPIITQKETMFLNKIKNILPDTKEEKLSFLELYTSILFFQKEENVQDSTELMEKIKLHKPWYNEQQIFQAINALSKLSFPG